MSVFFVVENWRVHVQKSMASLYLYLRYLRFDNTFNLYDLILYVIYLISSLPLDDVRQKRKHISGTLQHYL